MRRIQTEKDGFILSLLTPRPNHGNKASETGEGASPWETASSGIAPGSHHLSMIGLTRQGNRRVDRDGKKRGDHCSQKQIGAMGIVGEMSIQH